MNAWRFITVFGTVSLLADVVYEGARFITGPLLASLGATGLVVGVVTGLGEAAALGLRLVSGPLADRTRHFWAWTIAGYALTVITVPLLGITACCGWRERWWCSNGSTETNGARTATTPTPRAPLLRDFWIYCVFTASTMLGFATFGVLSFHMVHLGLPPAPQYRSSTRRPWAPTRAPR